MDDIKIVFHEDVTSIRIGEASGAIPRHLLSGEKAPAYVVTASTIEPYYFTGIHDRDGFRYIDFPKINLIAFNEITTTLRNQALNRLRELAHALQKLPKGYVNPDQGIIETWRIFFLPDHGVLILPQELSQVILFGASDETKRIHVTRFMRPNSERPFGLCHQFAQFLYLAATGEAPYEIPAVREDRFRHVPLAIRNVLQENDIAQWIDHTLSLTMQEQREVVSAAYRAEENLNWFLHETASFQWHCRDIVSSASQAESQFREKQQIRATRRRFLRQHGALLATVILAATLIFSIGGSMIYRAMQKPYTADLPPEGVISAFFAAQNELDVQKMSAPLARGVKNPFATEVSSLFVNSKIRQAYEGKESIIAADQWISSGKPPIDPGTFIYGNTQVHITQLDTDRYLAQYFIYYPIPEETNPSVLPLQVIRQTTEFILSDEKGYYLITEIIRGESQVEHIIEVPFKNTEQ
jgi:hypothetical protein